MKMLSKMLHCIPHKNEESLHIFPLLSLSVGDEGTIAFLTCEKKMIHRLSEMGFLKATNIRVQSISSWGPILVQIRGAKIALGRSIAEKIMVNFEK